MTSVNVTIGFVPSLRMRPTPWAHKMRADSLATIARVPGVKVVAPEPSGDGATIDAEKGLLPNGMVQTLDQAEALAGYFARQGVDGLVVCPVDFGDERSAAKVAEMLRVPILLYATKEPPAIEDASLARVSDSYCGNLSIASAFYRRKLPFHYAGIFFPSEPALACEIETFVRAVAVVKGIRGARLGQVGVRPSAFETVGYDETALIDKFGQNVIYAELSDLVLEAQGYADDDPRVGQVIDDLRSDVPTVSVANDYVMKSAKLEVALAEFWNEWRLSAISMQCWPSIQRLLGISNCALYGRLTQRGMLTACETDTLGAVAMLANHRAALGQTLPHFIDWTIQHRENPNWLLAWHCGNAPVSLARDRDAVALRSRIDMKGERPVQEGDPMAGLFQFQIKPGEVTFCRLAEYDGAWKMLVARGEIIPSDETLAGTWSWVQVADHARLYRTLVEEGFIHHASMIHGDQTAALTEACKFLDIRPVVVE